MYLLGLVDIENLPIAVIHYVAPVAVLLYFVSASSVPRDCTVVNLADTAIRNRDVAQSSSTATAPRGRQHTPSALLKWVFVLAVLTFVNP